MNYRHAFHAGNFADVMKHIILARVLTYLMQKDKPFRLIDTHAGIGLYSLDGEEAERTGEWVSGIGLLDEPFSVSVETLLEPYRRVLANIRARYGHMTYPGSPAIAREMLRKQDRAILIELHADDAVLLSERFNSVSNMKVLHLDGWTALHALIPPKEKRGLVLIDPPFEKPNELERMGLELVKALAKWQTGIYAAWYPIKSQQQVNRWVKQLTPALNRPVLRLELMIDKASDITQLNGCGLLIINPPWTLQAEADLLLKALAQRLGREGRGAFLIEQFEPI